MSSPNQLNPVTNKQIKTTSHTPSKSSPTKTLKNKDQKMKELESLIQTISRGKYMWESTFDAITSPVTIISTDYSIQRANKAAASAAKIDVRQLIGKKCYEILAGFSEPCRGCPLKETLKAKNPMFFLLGPFKKSSKQYEVNSYPLGSASDMEQVVMHYRDVTEEKKLQRRLVQSEKMAAIGMLAGGVAHEINNPLGGILAFVQLAIRDLPADHSAQADLKEIEDAALRCKQIVQDLLDFSRQSKEEEMTSVQLNKVLKKIIPLIQVQARSNRIEVAYELDPDLKLVRGNAQKLQQIFLNLVTNAYHAIGKGGELTLKTYMSQDRKMVCAHVSDSGPGIPPDHLGKIFDPYFTTKGQGEGTGLGLSISYGIVQEHGGHIEVKNNEDSGATFILSFPAI